MKTKTILVIFLMLSLVLSGCACRHEWAQASCTSPQVCTRCQETQGEALGHDWAAADCTRPQTCLRCGETQGQALGHSYAEWSFGETDMERCCTVCAQVQREPLDRGLQLEVLLRGCWEGWLLLHGDEAYTAYDFPIPLDMLCFAEDHGVSGHINTEEVAGSWEFLEYLEEEGQKNYIFSLHTSGDVQWKLLFSRRDEEDLLYLFYPNGDQVILRSNQTLAESLASLGSWAAPGGAGMYHLTFHPDRTLTGNLGQDFQGTWQLMPIQEDFGVIHSGLYIQYSSGGREVTLKATILPDDGSDGFVPETLSVSIQGAQYRFQPMSPEEIQRQSALLSSGPNAILGTWSSVYWRKFFDGYNIDHHLPGYSVTFHADNTFTASVGQELTGTWEYANHSFANDTVQKHRYYVQIHGQRNSLHLEYTSAEGQMPELHFSGSTVNHNDLKFLCLGRLTEADSYFLRAPEGKWTSTYEEKSTDNVQVPTMDYSFTFLSDGTYTGYDGEAVSGRWNLARIFYNDSGSTYHFDLRAVGASTGDDLILHTDGAEITSAEIRQSGEAYTRYIQLKQFTQEELDTLAAAPTFILGDWRSEYVIQGDSGDSVMTDAYTVTFHEDGTFTAQLDTPIQGTWFFDSYEAGSGCRYRFTFPGQTEFGYQYLFLNEARDDLSFSIVTEEKDDLYHMIR